MDKKEKDKLVADKDNNLLGSVIYEADNPKQQTLLVKDLNNNGEKEYPIDKNMNISYGNHKQSLNNFLSDKNQKELRDAIRYNENTSFSLSKDEINNVSKNLLTDKSFGANTGEEKEGSMHQLRIQYQSFQDKLKTESRGELTGEKITNRMTAENNYNKMKKNMIEKDPDKSNAIEKMERNVKAQQKQKNNSLSM